MRRKCLLAYFLSVTLASWAVLTQASPAAPQAEARPLLARHLDQLALNLKRHAVSL